MRLALFLLASACAMSYVYCNAIDASSVLLSTSGNANDYSNWASYAKKSEAKLDSILSKCFDCISEKYMDKNVCSNATGLNRITKEGIINAGASFLNAAQALYTLAYPKNTYGYNNAAATSGSYAPPQQPYQYNTNAAYGKSYGTGYSNYNNVNSFATSLSCMVGPEGQAVPMPCEYGNSYCQINMNEDNSYSCAAICVPSFFSICTTGALSNKWAPICLVGDLSSGSEGALPQMCRPGEVCLLNDDGADVLTGSCQDGCTPSPADTCFYNDFGNKQGPLCYVGTFGTDAELVGCGVGDSCARTTALGVITGSCEATCIPSSTVVCSAIDFGNKLGPICFVGQFGDYAVATACLAGQTCRRTTENTSFGTSITIGSCSTRCIPSETTFCCSSDLCNTYASEVNVEYRERERGQPIYGSGSAYGSTGYGSSSPYSGYAANNQAFNKYAAYNKPTY